MSYFGLAISLISCGFDKDRPRKGGRRMAWMDNTLASCVRFARSLLGALLRSFFPIVSASFPPACFLLIPQAPANESKKKRKERKKMKTGHRVTHFPGMLK